MMQLVTIDHAWKQLAKLPPSLYRFCSTTVARLFTTVEEQAFARMSAIMFSTSFGRFTFPEISGDEPLQTVRATPIVSSEAILLVPG